MAPSNKKKSKTKPAKPITTSSSPDSPAPLPARSPDSDRSPTTLDPHMSLTSATTTPSSPSHLFDFETFIDLADLDDIVRFCDAVASTQDGRNLKLFWDRAFEAGLEQGRAEEWRRGEEDRKKMYCEGKAKGIEEAEEAAGRAEVDLYYHGIEKGRTDERSEWTSAGHGTHCFAPTASLSHQHTQTESEPSTIQTPTTTCDANTQTFQLVTHISTQTEPVTAINLESSIDSDTLVNLCSRAPTASSDTALGAVWKCAFKKGHDDGSRIVDGLQITDILKTGFEKGQTLGIIQERETWEKAGHSQTCFNTAKSSKPTSDAKVQADLVALPPSTTVSVQVQTTATFSSYAEASIQTSSDFDPLNNPESVDLLCALSATSPVTTPLGLVWQCAFEAGARVSHLNISDDPVPLHLIDVSTQTSEPPQLIIQEPPQETSPLRLDWAEDAQSLPITQPVPLSRQPRDLSVLRSTSPSPFSSLQRRTKRPRFNLPRQSHRRHVPFNTDFPHPPSQPSRVLPLFSRSRQKPISEQAPEPKPVPLNWESDPRLSDLSRSLKALGWVLAT